MGAICTRACGFCNVATRLPRPLDPLEPTNTGAAVSELGLAHVVITSVDRDDLDDGGADHFAHTIREIRRLSPGTTIEILTPDFLRKDGALERVIDARPDVFNPQPRDSPPPLPGRAAGRTLLPFTQASRPCEGTRPDHVYQVGPHGRTGREQGRGWPGHGRHALGDIDFLTIGQYLQPTRRHHPVARFVPPDEFDAMARIARGKGVPDGLGITPYAFVIPCRRRLRAPACGRQARTAEQLSDTVRLASLATRR